LPSTTALTCWSMFYDSRVVAGPWQMSPGFRRDCGIGSHFISLRQPADGPHAYPAGLARPPDTRHPGAPSAAGHDHGLTRFSVEEQFSAGSGRAVVRWRYDWADGHVRGVDIVRVRNGQLAESLAYVKG
jgi:hypothetical protein